MAHLGAQAEMALVRRDPLAGALLAQAARAAEGLAPGPPMAAAAALARSADDGEAGPSGRARRKAAQALCRVAVQEAHAALLEGAGPALGSTR